MTPDIRYFMPLNVEKFPHKTDSLSFFQGIGEYLTAV